MSNCQKQLLCLREIESEYLFLVRENVYVKEKDYKNLIDGVL